MVADQSQPSQSSWSQHRDQLTKRVAGLAEAGVLEASAYQDFLASTLLPHRDQAHGMTNEAMQQVQIEFNDKLLQCIDGQIKDEGNLVISGMNDGQYIPEAESEMYSDQGHSSYDEVVSIRSRSSLGSDKTTVNASKTERPSHSLRTPASWNFIFLLVQHKSSWIKTWLDLIFQTSPVRCYRTVPISPRMLQW